MCHKTCAFITPRNTATQVFFFLAIFLARSEVFSCSEYWYIRRGQGSVIDGGVPLARSAERPRFLQVAGVITRGGNVVKTRSVHTLRRHAVNAADTMCGNTRGFLRPCSVCQRGFRNEKKKHGDKIRANVSCSHFFPC